jgi:hypothetical protein
LTGDDDSSTSTVESDRDNEAEINGSVDSVQWLSCKFEQLDPAGDQHVHEDSEDEYEEYEELLWVEDSPDNSISSIGDLEAACSSSMDGFAGTSSSSMDLVGTSCSSMDMSDNSSNAVDIGEHSSNSIDFVELSSPLTTARKISASVRGIKKADYLASLDNTRTISSLSSKCRRSSLSDRRLGYGQSSNNSLGNSSSSFGNRSTGSLPLPTIQEFKRISSEEHIDFSVFFRRSRSFTDRRHGKSRKKNSRSRKETQSSSNDPRNAQFNNSFPAMTIDNSDRIKALLLDPNMFVLNRLTPPKHETTPLGKLHTVVPKPRFGDDPMGTRTEKAYWQRHTTAATKYR